MKKADKKVKTIGKCKVNIFSLVGVFLIGFFYVLSMLSVIRWGIPGISHPFNYQMDEWHQFMAVKSVFKNFSNNVPGAAHGTMLQFLLTGFYLIPFYLLHIINPFVLKNSILNLRMQEKIFIILRLNSLIFGILTLLVLYRIITKYLKTSPFLPLLLFTATPIWISLSNYYKYDIALIFWITLSLLSFLFFSQHPTRKNYIICSIICALAFSTKVSAIPLFLSLVLAFFLFLPKYKNSYSTLLRGIVVYFAVICIVGIPDVLLGRASYGEFLYSVLITGPQGGGIILGMPQLIYLTVKEYPLIFGHGLYIFALLSACYWIMFLLKSIQKNNVEKVKTEFFLFITFILFVISLIPLQFSAVGNRSLVLLPLFIILIAVTVKDSLKRFAKQKILIYTVLTIICIIQVFESYAWLSVKLNKDPREVSSTWIIKNIPHSSTIGLENVPIYQLVPDVILKDFYNSIYKVSPTDYQYSVIDSSTPKLPPYIIITNIDYELENFNTSPKKALLIRMQKEGYKEIAGFYPNLSLYEYFGSSRNFYLSGLIPTAPIEIFEKK